MANFKGNRYMTRGINADIHPVLQNTMWSMIDEDIAVDLTMDYLQVFNLKPVTENGKRFQEIKHTQEQPKRERILNVDFYANLGIAPISEKVFVIDSGEYVTMMLADEYQRTKQQERSYVAHYDTKEIQMLQMRQINKDN